MPSLTTAIITTTEMTQTGYSTKTHLQIDRSFFVSHRTHAMIYFASLEIFIHKGGGTQRLQNHCVQCIIE